MSSRRRARAIAFQVIYQNDLNPEQSLAIKDIFIQSRLQDNRKLVAFAHQLIDGVNGHREEIDRRLSAIADNWKLSRMSATDRNVLRLGAFEILHFDTPDRVAINEAIDLSRRFGGEQSFQFVNGVLDKLIKQKQRGELQDAANAADDTVAAEQKPAAPRAMSTHGRGLLDHRRKPAERGVAGRQKPVDRKPDDRKPVEPIERLSDTATKRPVVDAPAPPASPDPAPEPESAPQVDSIFGKRKTSSVVVEVIPASDSEAASVESSDGTKANVDAVGENAADDSPGT